MWSRKPRKASEFPKVVANFCNWSAIDVSEITCSVHEAAGKSGRERPFLIARQGYLVIVCCGISLTGGSRYRTLGSITDHMSFQCGMCQYPVPAREFIFFSKQNYDLKSLIVKWTYTVMLKYTSQYMHVSYLVRFAC